LIEENWSALRVLKLSPSSADQVEFGNTKFDRVVEDLNQRRPNMKFFRKMFRDTKGATAIEYGLIAALIAVAAVAAMTSLGSTVGKTFNNVQTKMAG
jgi:pilus assembly protein Flp/PilA